MTQSPAIGVTVEVSHLNHLVLRGIPTLNTLLHLPCSKFIYEEYADSGRTNYSHCTKSSITSISTMDRKLEVSGWRAGWIERRSAAFQQYSQTASVTIAAFALVVAAAGVIRIRRASNQYLAATTTSEKAKTFKKLASRLRTVCRQHYAVAALYILNALVIMTTDAFIAMTVVYDDHSKHSDAYTQTFFIEAALYVAYIAMVFSACLFLAPLLQVLIATWILSKHAQRKGMRSLSDFIPQARFVTTHIAEIWACTCFFVAAYWNPSSKTHGFLRMCVLQGTLGSATVWMDAAFTFNFLAHKLEDEVFDLGTNGVKDVLKLFRRTVTVTHKGDKGSLDALPRYEEVLQADLHAECDDEKATEQA